MDSDGSSGRSPPTVHKLQLCHAQHFKHPLPANHQQTTRERCVPDGAHDGAHSRSLHERASAVPAFPEREYSCNKKMIKDHTQLTHPRYRDCPSRRLRHRDRCHSTSTAAATDSPTDRPSGCAAVRLTDCTTQKRLAAKPAIFTAILPPSALPPALPATPHRPTQRPRAARRSAGPRQPPRRLLH